MVRSQPHRTGGDFPAIHNRKVREIYVVRRIENGSVKPLAASLLGAYLH
jgi:hypothetical protein